VNVRLSLFIGVVVVTAAAATGYVLVSRNETQHRRTREAAAVSTGGDLAAVTAAPHLAFRTTALGDSYGHVALAPLAAPDGPRVVTPASCERVHAARDTAICLATSGGFAVTYTARVLGPDWAPKRTLPLAGIPSRARISRDGELIATTSFIRGDSYASAGQFSTRTLVSRADGRNDVNLEDFALLVNAKAVTTADRNLWGVTFVDADRFYATAASGGKTWLVRGSLNAHSLTALQEDAECPSVSPDGGRIVYKKRGRLPPGQWRLTAYDVGTGAEIPLAETRSVDDQVDWLDGTHVVYGLPRPGAAAATSDIWSVPADGGGAPSVLVHDAWSPAVVR
jgi:hypothetical protein